MRQAEKSIGDKAGEFGLEMLGYYDVQRVFGESDPITGEKVSGVDRLFATGMLALSLYPPGKAVGVTGKVAIKGVNAGTKTGTKFGLSSIAKSLPSIISLKNVVSTGKVLEVFKGVYKQVVEAPLAATKLWMDRTVRQIAEFRMSDFGLQPAFAMGGSPTKIVGDAFGETKDPFVKMVKGDGDNSLGSGKVSPEVIRKVDHDILDMMESAGGHTLERHISKTNEELIKRAIKENVDATSYTDKSTAIKAVQENLRKNTDSILLWLNESNVGRKIFDVSHKNSVGKAVLEDNKQVLYNLKNSRIVLVKDSSQELGFKILTSFPIIK